MPKLWSLTRTMLFQYHVNVSMHNVDNGLEEMKHTKESVSSIVLNLISCQAKWLNHIPKNYQNSILLRQTISPSFASFLSFFNLQSITCRTMYWSIDTILEQYFSDQWPNLRYNSRFWTLVPSGIEFQWFTGMIHFDCFAWHGVRFQIMIFAFLVFL